MVFDAASEDRDVRDSQMLARPPVHRGPVVVPAQKYHAEINGQIVAMYRRISTVRPQVAVTDGPAVPVRRSWH
jgi:hypothetical protein